MNPDDPRSAYKPSNIRNLYIVYVGDDRRGAARTLAEAEHILDALCIQGEGDWGYGSIMLGEEVVARRYREYQMPLPVNDEERERHVERLQRLLDRKLSEAERRKYFDRWEAALKRQSEEEGS